MSALDMYWLTRLDRILNIFSGFATAATLIMIISIVIFIAGICMREANKEFNHDNHIDRDWMLGCSFINVSKKPMIISFCVMCILIIIRSFTPTTKEMISIIVLPKIATSSNISTLEDISKDMLDVTASWLKEIKSKNKQKANLNDSNDDICFQFIKDTVNIDNIVLV